MTVDSVKIVGDEDGEHLLVTTIDGDEFDFRLPSDIARDLAFVETLPIRLHWAEGLAAKEDKPSHWPEWELTEEKQRQMFDTARDIQRGK